VNLSLDAVLVEKLLEDGGIACGNLLAVEPLYTIIVDLLGNSQRQAALRETTPMSATPEATLCGISSSRR